jgi:hypothetical protein
MAWLAFAIIFAALLFQFPKAIGSLVLAGATLAVIGFLYLWWDNSHQAERAAQYNAAAAAQAAAETAAEEKARQAAAAEQARQQELARDEEIALNNRRTMALHGVVFTDKSIRCDNVFYLNNCGSYTITAIVKNQSLETLTAITFGWLIMPPGTKQCPSYIASRYSEKLSLGRGDTALIRLGGNDSMNVGTSQNLTYCLKITDVEVQP